MGRAGAMGLQHWGRRLPTAPGSAAAAPSPRTPRTEGTLFPCPVRSRVQHQAPTWAKLWVSWYSQSIMSKKMGMVALRSSGSGTSVISRIGLTMPGMNSILRGPGNGECEGHAVDRHQPKGWRLPAGSEGSQLVTVLRAHAPQLCMAADGTSHRLTHPTLPIPKHPPGSHIPPCPSQSILQAHA